MKPAAWIVLLLGCASGAQGKDQELMTDVRAFQEGLRWRKYDQAADHVHAAARVAFLDAHDELDGDLRIDDYEVLRVTLTGEREATVRVKYTWHLDSVGRVHESIVDQSWSRHGSGKSAIWRIMATDARSGEPLPEAAMPADAVEETGATMR
jgi:hypothetical protein